MKGKENSMEPLIRVSHVRKIYRMGTEKIVALDDVSLDINRGDIVCLLGASGSGKSTFLNMLAGLEKPTRGEIWVGKVPVHKLNEEQVTLFRQKNIGFIFQAYNLMNAMTAEENVSLPLLFRGMAKEERLKRARRAMATVGLKGLEKRRPNQMSGGQQQRVGIARAIVGTPKIIFADEPTGNLDSVTTKEVMELIIDQVRTHKQTLILVTHDQSIASYADIIVTIRDGNIIHIDRKDPPPEEGAAIAPPPGGAIPEDTNEPEQTAEPNRKEGTEE
jgi:putative ABC transport system ATP-binding protein